MTRKHPAIFWVRTIHRWISMAFVVVAAILIIGILPLGTPAGDVLSTVAIVLLVGLLITGIWMAVHHYTAGARGRRRRASASVGA